MPRDQKIQMTPDREKNPLSRRKALARLGLGAAAVYAAPVILQIDRESQALAATPCNTSKGKGKGQNKSPSWCRRRRR
tara:strand:+ start:1938 stop:2171 length:234 start_codon:yes stop_codon:yes gene_type:complete